MNLIELLNLQIYEKINKFFFNTNFKLSLFFVISFNPLLIDQHSFDLFSIMNILEGISGQSPIIRKIFFKKANTTIKFIVQSTNINKLFILNFLLYICLFNSLIFLKHLSLKLILRNINNNILLKLQHFTLLSNFYGNLEKYINSNVKYDLYAVFNFNKSSFNYFYSNMLLDLH